MRRQEVARRPPGWRVPPGWRAPPGRRAPPRWSKSSCGSGRWFPLLSPEDGGPAGALGPDGELLWTDHPFLGQLDLLPPSPQEWVSPPGLGATSAGPQDEDLRGASAGGRDQDQAGEEALERCGGGATQAGGREGPFSGVGEQRGEEREAEGEEEAHLAFLG